MQKTMRQMVTAVVLTALLALPVLPAHAGDGSVPGFFGWLDAWFQNVTSWFTGDSTTPMDAVTATAETEGGTVAHPVPPKDLTDGTQTSTEGSDDSGPRLDPTG